MQGDSATAALGPEVDGLSVTVSERSDDDNA